LIVPNEADNGRRKNIGIGKTKPAKNLAVPVVSEPTRIFFQRIINLGDHGVGKRETTLLLIAGIFHSKISGTGEQLLQA
jgi:hypothetical protein